jgi:hypothetical protein
MWWLEAGGGWRLPLHVLRLDEATEGHLIDALSNSTEYEPTEIHGYPAFTRDYENEISRLSLAYAFVGDLWVATSTPTNAPLLEQIMSVVIDRVAAPTG